MLHHWLSLGGKLRGEQELLLMGVLLGRNVVGEQELSLMGVLLGRNVLGEQSLGIKTRWRDCARRSSRCSTI